MVHRQMVQAEKKIQKYNVYKNIKNED
jgi:hypothetical protein